MSDPFLGEVRMVGFNFAPVGWQPCNGQLLPIASNSALFAIIGTTFGGDGIRTFALPDLRGRVPAHPGPSMVTALGQQGGSETVALTTSQIPAHTHVFNGSLEQAASAAPIGNVLAAKSRRGVDVFAAPPPNVGVNAQDLVGGGVGHDNLQPYLAVNFVIAIQGIFPSRN
jgi:microcystin-dependent protein